MVDNQLTVSVVVIPPASSARPRRIGSALAAILFACFALSAIAILASVTTPYRQRQGHPGYGLV
jgi:hypothetical protein